MPEVSRFFGIVIRMHYREHAPPHFHAIYGDFEAEIAIQSLELLEGRLPPRALGLTIEWAGQHQEELMMDWGLAATHQRSPGSTRFGSIAACCASTRSSRSPVGPFG